MVKHYLRSLAAGLVLAAALAGLGLHIKRPPKAPHAPHVPHPSRAKGGSGDVDSPTRRRTGSGRTPVHPPLSRAQQTARTRATGKGRPKPRAAIPKRPGAPARPKGQPRGRRNAHLAGKTHKSGVPFDKDGYPDFRDHLHPIVREVRIVPTGSRTGDRDAAIREAMKQHPGLTEADMKDYRWHHHQERGRMQLVEAEAHDRTGHDGGFREWYK